MDVLEEIKERLDIFKNLYDEIRLVDPVHKTILATQTSGCRVESDMQGANCYEIWKRNGMCKHCVSYRALIEGRSISKFERSGEQLYWTLATPCEYEGKTYIVELIKSITDADYLVANGYKTCMPLHSTVMSLNDLANTDGLTNIFNRRYIDTQLSLEIDKAGFHEEDLSILLIDIDHFKRINDTYGHLVGDQILVKFVESIATKLRQEVDWIGRYGGEEFLVVLNRTSLDEACLVAERIRFFIEHCKYEIDDLQLSITCSVGVATSEKGKFGSRWLLKQADECLYRAKISGRNKINGN